MIAGNITGAVSDGSDKLFNLLALVSNPKLYEARIKELQDSIAKNATYVDAVGKVDDLLRLRNEAAALKSEAEKTLLSAREDAAGILAKAKSDADDMAAEAKKEADQMKADTKQLKSAATAQKKALDEREASLKVRQSQLDARAAELEAKVKKLDEALASAEAAAKEAAKIKEETISKHKAFLETL